MRKISKIQNDIFEVCIDLKFAFRFPDFFSSQGAMNRKSVFKIRK